MANATDNRAKKLNPAESPRLFYGSEMRFKREQAGLSREELGARVFMSGSYIAYLEKGARRVPPDLAAQLDEILETDGFFVRNLEAGRSSPHPEFFADVAELESFAAGIRVWEPQLIPGLLQTKSYARAVIRGWDPVLSEEAVTKRLDARMTRARIFDNADKPLYWAIVHESALRSAAGGPTVMAEQLRHVAAMVRRNRIILQVLPFSAGAHAGMGGALKLMTFDDDTPVAYLPSMETGRLSDDPGTVKRFALAYDLLGAAAQPPEASLTLIEAVAEEYEHGIHVRPDGGGVA